MRRSLFVFLVSTLAAAACDSTSLPFEPKDGDIPLPKNTVEGTGSVAELRTRRSAWLTAGPKNYRVEEQLFCFCGFQEPNPAVLEVRSAQITRAWDRRTAAEFSASGNQSKTIERLFDFAIERAERGERIRVAYDAVFGYPARLTFGEPEVDAGVTYLLANLAVSR
jgi:hypothetical protein